MKLVRETARMERFSSRAEEFVAQDCKLTATGNMLPFPTGNFSDGTKTNAASDCLFHFFVGEPLLN